MSEDRHTEQQRKRQIAWDEWDNGLALSDESLAICLSDTRSAVDIFQAMRQTGFVLSALIQLEDQLSRISDNRSRSMSRPVTLDRPVSDPLLG